MSAFQRAAYRPLWVAARRRLEGNGGHLAGSPLVLRDLTADEADAVAGLLGVARPRDGVIRVRLDRLDDALRRSPPGRGLVATLESTGGPLRDRRAERAAAATSGAATWDALARHPAAVADPRLGAWLSDLRRSGLARRLARDAEARTVSVALDVLARLPADGVRLAVLAAETTGDAHGLDRRRPAGTLVVHALAFRAGRPFPEDAADWRRAWADAGVACDDLSCDVLALGLPGGAEEPLRLTLRQATRWRPPHVPACAFVCENPAVVAAAADAGVPVAPLVCVEGIPSTAALCVLGELAAAGSRIRYHGDFDWRGLAIATVVARKVPGVEPWRFSGADYLAHVGASLGTMPLTGRRAASPWDPALAEAMSAAGVAVYEEQVLDGLLADVLAPGT